MYGTKQNVPDTSLPMHLGWGGASTWSNLASRPEVPYITTYLQQQANTGITRWRTAIYYFFRQ